MRAIPKPKNCEEYDGYVYKRASEMTSTEIAELDREAEKARRWMFEKYGIVFPRHYNA